MTDQTKNAEAEAKYKAKIKQQAYTLLVKWGSSPKDAQAMIDAEFDMAFSCFPDAPARYYADFIRTVA